MIAAARVDLQSLTTSAGPLVVAIVASYLLGSIPAAYIAGKSKGIDLRKHGSGNLGATNVIRVLGTKVGLLVFAFDMAKGAAPVLLFPRWVASAAGPIADPVIVGIICGIAAIIGHVRPIYLKFGRGGKGVATAAGVFLALAPVQTLLTLIVFAGWPLEAVTSPSVMPTLTILGTSTGRPSSSTSDSTSSVDAWMGNNGSIMKNNG